MGGGGYVEKGGFNGRQTELMQELNLSHTHLKKATVAISVEAERIHFINLMPDCRWKLLNEGHPQHNSKLSPHLGE